MSEYLIEISDKNCPKRYVLMMPSMTIQVLDVSNVISLSSECLLQLFFHDLYHTLHQFVFLPEHYRTFDDGYAQDPDCTPDKIHPHDLTRYCPWCLDDWDAIQRC